MYRATHKEWDWKEGLKLIYYDDPKVEFSLLHLKWLGKEGKQITVSGNHEYKETGSFIICG